MINKDEFETYLSQLFEEDYVVKKAMNYSLLAKSKRVRPLILLNMLADLKVDFHVGLPAASALEMVHSYSLIHDDLPAFDNDDFRRGKPTCHKAFDEETAILAGDGLLTESFNVICSGEYTDTIKVKLVGLLASYAGVEGMIKGQSFDMAYEKVQPTIEELTQMQLLKTGKLLTVPFLMALTIANKEELIPQFIELGKKLGLVFQIQDDILDVISSQEQLGKSNSDINNNKTTFVSLIGVEDSMQKVSNLFAEIYQQLSTFKNTKELIEQLENRKW